MKVELTRAERLILGQVLNVKVQNATLREHIALESMFTMLDVDSIKLPVATDFVKPEEVELFSVYNGKPISEIADEQHKKTIQEAMTRQRIEELKVWANEDTELAPLNLSNEQVDMVKRFFEKDERPFPREYHKAIVALHGKLFK